jgi:tight adherence protein C
MLSQLIAKVQTLGLGPDQMAIFGVAFGMLIFVFGLVGTFAREVEFGRRMAVDSPNRPSRRDFDLVRAGDQNPSGILKAFIPSSKDERSRIAKKLRRAGIHRPNAVRTYYLIRSLLAMVLPMALAAFYFLPQEVLFKFHLVEFRASLTWERMLQIVTALIVLGFYGPSVWLNRRIKNRREAIRMSMPNALDLLQVSIEAGLSFDAAVARVAHEMAKATPEISEEFLMMELEIQAGKDRDRALNAMAERVNLDEMTSFINVILQSAQFGSSISNALATYSSEMRVMRELKAQEKANQLPVKMSAVMAALMMPTMLLICLAPIVIRFMHMWQDMPYK